LFSKCRHDCCDTQTVKLPAQQVEVERAAPRITVTDTTRVSRAAYPAIGTIYMPMAVPLAGFATGRDFESTRDEEYDALRTAHMAERAKLRHDQARSALNAEVEAKKRVLERLGTPDSTPAPSDLNDRINKISDKIDKLTDRVSSLEKLVLIHDNYLREQIKNLPHPETTPAPKTN
jgi:hypothetical protein